MWREEEAAGRSAGLRVLRSVMARLRRVKVGQEAYPTWEIV